MTRRSKRIRGRHRIAAVVLMVFAAVAGSRCPAADAEDAPASAGLTAERILDDTRVIDVSIDMVAEDWETLRNQSRDGGRAFFGEPKGPNPFTWFRADVVIDGVPVGEVGVRKKGFIGSLDTTAPSLLIDFNRFIEQSPVEGLGRLTLNNNKQDRSLLSQTIAYRLFREAGVPAARTGFADVSVNGERLGIYTNVEPIRRPFLARVFGDGGGALWEGTLADIVPQSFDRLDEEQVGTPANAERLAELGALLAGEEEIDPERVGRLVDLGQFLRFWCVESLIGFWDGYCGNQNNFFVYASPSDGRFRFIPWGADATLSPGFGFPRFGGTRTAAAVLAQAVLPNRLYFAEGMADRYRQELRAVMADVWNEDVLLAEIDRLEALLAPRLGERQQGAAQATEEVRNFVRSRRGEIEAALESWPAEAPTTWRRPPSSRPIGTAEGSFAATYREGAMDDVPPGEATLTVELEGQPIDLTAVEVSVSTFTFPFPGGRGPGGPPGPGGRGSGGPAGRGGSGGFPPPGGPPGGPPDIRPGPPRLPFGPGGHSGEPPVGVVITGTRSDDGQPFTLNLFLDRRRIAAGEAEVPVNGMVGGGPGGFGFPGMGGMRTIAGTFHPEDRGTAPGARLSGRLELRVAQMEGGPMSRAPMRRPGEPAKTEP